MYYYYYYHYHYHYHYHYYYWGSAVSSCSGVWGGAAAEIGCGAF